MNTPSSDSSTQEDSISDLLCEMTNEAASQIEMDQLNEALMVLQSALQSANRLLPGHLLEETTAGVSSQQDTRRKSHRRKRAAARRKEVLSLEEEPSVRQQPPNVAPCRPSTKFVYTHPLRVIDRYDPPPFEELVAYLLYNLALVHQRKALKKKKRTTTKHWHQAVHYYHILEEYLEQTETCDLPPTFHIALLNNRGQAYWAMGQLDQADSSWNQMLFTLLVYLPGDVVDCTSAFLENAAHLLGSASPVAVAA